MKSNKIIEHIAHSMIMYDNQSGQKTWRELATVAYYAHIDYLNREELTKNPQTNGVTNVR
jgi:hypothetical protein